MNILLTGHKGFIGNRLHAYLQAKDHSVIPMDILSGTDILTTGFPHNIHIIIHLAGLSGVRDSLNNPTEYWKTNVLGSQRIFDFYKKKYDTRIIYASSSTAYEPWRNPYALSKYGMEQLEHPNSLGLIKLISSDYHCHSHTHNTTNFDSISEISTCAEVFENYFGYQTF